MSNKVEGSGGEYNAWSDAAHQLSAFFLVWWQIVKRDARQGGCCCSLLDDLLLFH